MQGVRLITRKAWGARRPRRVDELPIDQAEGVAIHHSAGAAPASHRQCFAAARAIQNHHMDVKGWNDGAYSHLVCPHGFTFRLRGIGVRTAANGTTKANDRYYAICLLGTDLLTPAAARELANLLRWYKRQLGSMRVRPHSDFVATDCPGSKTRAWLKRRLWEREVTT